MNDVVISGIGLVSSLGIGAEAHWQALSESHPLPVTDSQAFAPYTVHPLPEIDWSGQIPRRGDQRQMETWQRLGVYAAGLALDDAGLKENEELCATMDMVVAAGGGERDMTVDNTIIEQARDRSDREILLNEVLTTELRPTLFLAQLANLLAGNISIVHKVTGSSRTLMGEDTAGLSAVYDAVARIRNGQSTHALVGASYNACHPDMLLAFELGGLLQEGPWQPIRKRSHLNGGGVVTGSGGAFLVLESSEHVLRRGGRSYARIDRLESSCIDRQPGELASTLDRFLSSLDDDIPLISATSGSRQTAQAELFALSCHPDMKPRLMADLTGYMKEAQLPFALALAALALENGGVYPPFDRSAEDPFEGPPSQIGVLFAGLGGGEAVIKLVGTGDS